MLTQQESNRSPEQFVYNAQNAKKRKHYKKEEKEEKRKKRKMSMKEYEGSKEDKEADEKELAKINSKKRKHYKKEEKRKKKAEKHMKETTPKGAHGRAAVHALGRTKTTGNFKKIEAKEGKGAAIAAYQNKLAVHQGRPAPFTRKAKSGEKMLKHAMKHMKFC